MIQFLNKGKADIKFFNGYKICLGLSNKIVEHSEPYIESTGTQYLSLGYRHKSNTKIVIDCQIAEPVEGTRLALFGTNWNNFIFYVRYNSQNVPVFMSPASASTVPTLGSNFIYNERIKVSAQLQTCSWNNEKEEYSVNSPDTITTGSTPILLFTYNKSISANGVNPATTPYTSAKVYGIQIYEGNLLVRDYVPILDDQKVACLYETLNSTYHYNLGEGELLAGGI